MVSSLINNRSNNRKEPVIVFFSEKTEKPESGNKKAEKKSQNAGSRRMEREKGCAEMTCGHAQKRSRKERAEYQDQGFIVPRFWNVQGYNVAGKAWSGFFTERMPFDSLCPMHRLWAEQL